MHLGVTRDAVDPLPDEVGVAVVARTPRSCAGRSSGCPRCDSGGDRGWARHQAASASVLIGRNSYDRCTKAVASSGARSLSSARRGEVEFGMPAFCASAAEDVQELTDRGSGQRPAEGIRKAGPLRRAVTAIAILVGDSPSDRDRPFLGARRRSPRS
jgi:hypothetical protein